MRMGGPVPSPALRVAAPPLAPARAASQAPGAAQGRGIAINGAITLLLTLGIVMIFTISSSLLQLLKINYVTNAGAAYEKIHPGTYVLAFAFALMLVRNSDPIGELNRLFAGSKLVVVYAFTLGLLFIHTVSLGRPFSGIIDTFALPLILALVVWSRPHEHTRLLGCVVHAVILINVAVGYYEFLSGHRLVPLNVGGIVITGEWRASALLGHPLKAAGDIGAYIVALLVRPALIPSLALRLATILLCLGSLTVFGGRTALVLVSVVMAGVLIVEGARLMRGAKVPLPTVIIAICMISAAIAIAGVLLQYGFFDKMLTRFSSDKGSASARVASLQLVMLFDWRELMLGPDTVRANALQAMMGLTYGIESFWLSSIVQYGVIHTVLLTIGLACFFAEIIRRGHPGARVLTAFAVILAASSVSFSSKNTHLTEYVIILTLLLGRERGADRVPTSLRRGP